MEELIKVAKDLAVREISEVVEMQNFKEEVSSDKKSECPECGKAFSQRGHMLSHYRFIHKNINYPCNQCDFKASRKHDLQKHIQSKHEGIKYPCNQCDYQATQQGHLQRHIQSKHG